MALGRVANLECDQSHYAVDYFIYSYVKMACMTSMFSSNILVTNPILRRYEADTPFIALRSTVANALVHANLIPIAIGPEMDEAAVLWLYEQCAGVVFSGGVDWNPKWYNQEPAKGTDAPQDTRDAVEQLLYERVLTDKKPVVGICRGMQGLAIALYRQHAITAKESIIIQEISQVTTARHCVEYEEMHANKHEVIILPDTIAHEIFGSASVLVPKGNHQAVNKRVAESLLPHIVISGVSAKDDLTEIIELKRAVHPFCFAMQGHPEVDTSLYPAVFKRLAAEAQQYAIRHTHGHSDAVSVEVVA